MTDTEIKQEIGKFVEVIRNSQIFQNYTEAKEEIKKDPELFRQIIEFRQRNFELQTNTPEDKLMDASEDFEREYEDFRANPLVDRFLGAELAFCRMMQEITEEITSAMDFE